MDRFPVASTQPRQATNFAVRLLPVLLGIVAFLVVTGGNMLAPTNVLWLQHTDLAQSYLGWAFYRHDPWGWPWGASPSYGLEFHSSVYYSDSIPLMAMLLKPLSPLLPEPFQYFGLWVLLCFVLQALFAWQLVSLATRNVAARSLGCVFFLLAPPLLARLGGHMALFAQWPILAALLLYLKPLAKRQRLAWTMLVATTMLIHAYIFLMVVLVWMADLVRRAYGVKAHEQISLRGLARRYAPEAAQVILLTVAVAWMAGFFMVSGSGQAASGFGYYKMNLLAPFNGSGWSWFGLNLPEAPGEYEGFNYFGVGGLVLCAIALILQLRGRNQTQPPRHLWPLAALALMLTLAALTHHIGIGTWQATLPLPRWLDHKLSHSSIQSTGRLFWLAYYAFLVWALITLGRTLSSRAMVALLAAAVLLQMVDLRPGLTNWRETLVRRTEVDDTTHLRGPFWDASGGRYTQLRMIPTQVLGPGWEVLARYALEHRMGTDAVQLARVNWKLFNRLRREQSQLIANGTPETHTLYILDNAEVAKAAHAVRPGDALFRLDGWNVLAPDWDGALPAGAIDLKTPE